MSLFNQHITTGFINSPPKESGFYICRFGKNCDDSTIDAGWVDYCQGELSLISEHDNTPVRLLSKKIFWLKIEMNDLAKMPTFKQNKLIK